VAPHEVGEVGALERLDHRRFASRNGRSATTSPGTPSRLPPAGEAPREVLGSDPRVGGQERRVLDEAPQLAHVPGQRQRDRRPRPRVESHRGEVVDRAQRVEEPLRDQRHVSRRSRSGGRWTTEVPNQATTSRETRPSSAARRGSREVAPTTRVCRRPATTSRRRRSRTAGKVEDLLEEQRAPGGEVGEPAALPEELLLEGAGTRPSRRRPRTGRVARGALVEQAGGELLARPGSPTKSTGSSEADRRARRSRTRSIASPGRRAPRSRRPRVARGAGRGSR